MWSGPNFDANFGRLFWPRRTSFRDGLAAFRGRIDEGRFGRDEPAHAVGGRILVRGMRVGALAYASCGRIVFVPPWSTYPEWMPQMLTVGSYRYRRRRSTFGRSYLNFATFPSRSHVFGSNFFASRRTIATSAFAGRRTSSQIPSMTGL